MFMMRQLQLSSPIWIAALVLCYSLRTTVGNDTTATFTSVVDEDRSPAATDLQNSDALMPWLSSLLWIWICLLVVCIANYIGCKPASPSSNHKKSKSASDENIFLTSQAQQQIRANQNYYASILSEAIQLRTISYDPYNIDAKHKTDPKPLLQMHQLLRDSFPLLHKRYPPKIIHQYSLLYVIPGQDASLLPILLCAHLDVVPANNEDNSWTHDPFSGKIIDGVIWGRGAIDNKHNFVAQLGALEHMIQNGIVDNSTSSSFQRSVYVAIGHDEEIGGPEGAANIAKFLKNEGLRFEGIVDEGSMMIRGAIPGLAKDVNVGLISCAEKGMMSVELTIRGSGGHSSMPPIHGDGLINAMGKAVAKLEANPFPAHFDRDDYFRKNLEVLAWRLSPPMRFLCSNLWLFGPMIQRILVRASNGAAAMLRTTTAVTKISGGDKINVMPSSVSVFVNHRVHPSDSMASVLEYDRKIIRDDRIEVRPLKLSCPPSPCSRTDVMAYDWIQRSVELVFGNPCAPSLLTGNTDTRHYWDLSDNIYRFSPINLHISEVGMFHGVNERISTVALRQMVEYYETLIMMSCAGVQD